MKLVEVVRGLSTSDETFATVINVCKRLDKVPVEVNDYPGFVANRILMPMINEAAYCVMEGVATPEAIDTVMTLGMNHPMGPLRLATSSGSMYVRQSWRCSMADWAIRSIAPAAPEENGCGGKARTKIRPGILRL